LIRINGLLYKAARLLSYYFQLPLVVARHRPDSRFLAAHILFGLLACKAIDHDLAFFIRRTEIIMKRRLLDTIFETVANDIQVLEPIRNNQQVVIDFRNVLKNKATSSHDGTTSSHDGVKASHDDETSSHDGVKSSHGGDGSSHDGELLFERIPEAKDNSLFEKLGRVVDTGEPLDDIFHYTEDGHDKWFHIKAQKYGDRVVVAKEDLTASKQAEESLTLLNRSLFAKNRELEALSSELKTFNAIAANDYLETLRSLYTCLEFIISNDAKNLSDPGKANVRRAQSAIQKLKLLTDDIVSFSKITPNEPLTKIDLDEIMLTVLHNSSKKIQEAAAKINYTDLPTIHGYPLLLTILFTHLVDNAIKFRRDNTDHVVSVAHLIEEGSNIDHPAALKDVRYHVISVVDNGIGFPEQEKEKIFNMFYKLSEKGKNKGPGIGLAICKKIMDLHEGFIAAECKPDCTTFRCYFQVDPLSP
jgi:signal transduction histidine kinase